MFRSDPESLLHVADLVTHACRHLRSKGMSIFNDGCGVEGLGNYDDAIYWCTKTMKGPDHDPVDREDCCLASRSCYEPEPS